MEKKTDFVNTGSLWASTKFVSPNYLLADDERSLLEIVKLMTECKAWNNTSQVGDEVSMSTSFAHSATTAPYQMIFYGYDDSAYVPPSPNYFAITRSVSD